MLLNVARVNNTAVTGHQEEGQQDGPYVWDEAQQVLGLVMMMMMMLNDDVNDQGVILGMFFYGYVLTQLPGGRLAEIVGGKWLFGVGGWWHDSGGTL